MNAHQRRKRLRRLSRAIGSPPQLIPDWEALAKVPPSATHFLDIDINGGNGWVVKKGDELETGHYLSTHAFYGSNHRRSTLRLRQFGFNVTLANWDA